MTRAGWTDLGEEQSRGEERDIEDVQLALGRLVGDARSGEDISGDTKQEDFEDGLPVSAGLANLCH